MGLRTERKHIKKPIIRVRKTPESSDYLYLFLNFFKTVFKTRCCGLKFFIKKPKNTNLPNELIFPRRNSVVPHYSTSNPTTGGQFVLMSSYDNKNQAVFFSSCLPIIKVASFMVNILRYRILGKKKLQQWLELKSKV